MAENSESSTSTEFRINTSTKRHSDPNEILDNLTASSTPLTELVILISQSPHCHDHFLDSRWWRMVFARVPELEHLRIRRTEKMSGWGRGGRSHDVLVAVRTALQLGCWNSAQTELRSGFLPKLETLHLAPISVRDLIPLRFSGGAVFEAAGSKSASIDFWYRIKTLVVTLEAVDESWREDHKTMAMAIIRDYLHGFSLWLQRLIWTWLTASFAIKGPNPLFLDDQRLEPKKKGKMTWIVWKELCIVVYARTTVSMDEMQRLFCARAGMLRTVEIGDNGMGEYHSMIEYDNASFIQTWKHGQGVGRVQVLNRNGPSWVTPEYEELEDEEGSWTIAPITQREYREDTGTSESTRISLGQEVPIGLGIANIQSCAVQKDNEPNNSADQKDNETNNGGLTTANFGRGLGQLWSKTFGKKPRNE